MATGLFPSHTDATWHAGRGSLSSESSLRPLHTDATWHVGRGGVSRQQSRPSEASLSPPFSSQPDAT